MLPPNWWGSRFRDFRFGEEPVEDYAIENTASWGDMWSGFTEESEEAGRFAPMLHSPKMCGSDKTTSEATDYES
jgi:hypothetical protein